MESILMEIPQFVLWRKLKMLEEHHQSDALDCNVVEEHLLPAHLSGRDDVAFPEHRIGAGADRGGAETVLAVAGLPREGVADTPFDDPVR